MYLGGVSCSNWQFLQHFTCGSACDRHLVGNASSEIVGEKLV